MSIGDWFAAIAVFSICVGFVSLIYWRRDVTRRNAYLQIMSEAAKIRDEARLFLAKAQAISESSGKELEYSVCQECGKIRSRFEIETGKCIECAVKQA